MHRLDDRDDDALLKLIQEGSHQAFAALVRRHAERFYRIAYRFTASRTEAEDAVQEAFLKLWERPHLWESGQGARFTTWFYRIVVNGCLDRKRKKTEHAMPDDMDIADHAALPEDTLIEREEQRLLEQEIQTLPERQQAALNLCFYEGLSNQEAADVMGVPLKALQSLLMRGKTTLKQRLGLNREVHYARQS